MTSGQMPRMLTVSEVAELLRCSAKHVRNLAQNGFLRAIKRPSAGDGEIKSQSRVLIEERSVRDFLGANRIPARSGRIRRALAAGLRLGFGPPEGAETRP